MPRGVCVHCSRHVSTDVHLTTANFMEEVEGVGFGGRRDAVSCSRDCVTLSIRVVKRGRQLTHVSVLPSTLSAAPSL